MLHLHLGLAAAKWTSFICLLMLSLRSVVLLQTVHMYWPPSTLEIKLSMSPVMWKQFYFVCSLDLCTSRPLLDEHVLSHKSHWYEKVLGKWMDSIWFLTLSFRMFWYLLQIVQTFLPEIVSLPTYLNKSEGVSIIPMNEIF